MRGKRFWGARSRSHYVAKVKDYTEYILEPKSELRFEVEDQNNKVCLTVRFFMILILNTISI